MILVVGLAALAQMLYLPGALLRHWLDPDSHRLERLPYAVALSLTANTVLVTLLVLTHSFSRVVLWAVMVAETGALIAIALRKHRSRPVRSTAEPSAYRGERLGPVQAAAVIALLSAGAILLYIGYLNWGTVFSANDDVANWDRWAMEWAGNTWPTAAGLYPQLMPINWSITYVLLGRDDIKFFAKATTTIYPLLTVALFASLGVRRRNPAFFWGAAVYARLLLHVLGVAFLMLGYADVPLAFFGFLTFHAIYRRKGDPTGSDVVLMLVFAAATVLAKQGGVFTVVVAAAYAAWRVKAPLRTARPAAATWIAPALTCSLAAGWFVVVWLQIRRGEASSNLMTLTETLHHGRSYGERLIAAWGLFWHLDDAGHAFAAITAALMVGGLLIRETRWIVLVLLAPFLVGWGWWFSYELRTASPSFPFIALVAGVTMSRLLGGVERKGERMQAAPSPLLASLFMIGVSLWILAKAPGLGLIGLKWVDDPANRFSSITTWYAWATAGTGAVFILWQFRPRASVSRRLTVSLAATVGAVLVTWAAFGPYRDEAIVAGQREARQRIGIPSLNTRLYDAVRVEGLRSRIATNYFFLRELPGLEAYYLKLPCIAPCGDDELRKIVADHPEVGSFLLRDSSADLSGGVLQARPYRTVFAQDGYRLLAIDREGDRAALAVPAVFAVSQTGSGLERHLSLRLAHQDGAIHIAGAIIIVNASLDGRHACYLQWYHATNVVTLAHDDGAGWIGERRLGLDPPLANSQCTVVTLRGALTESDTTLDLSLRLKFAAAFQGQQTVYVDVLGDGDKSSGYRPVTTWDVR